MATVNTWHGVKAHSRPVQDWTVQLCPSLQCRPAMGERLNSSPRPVVYAWKAAGRRLSRVQSHIVACTTEVRRAMRAASWARRSTGTALRAHPLWPFAVAAVSDARALSGATAVQQNDQSVPQLACCKLLRGPLLPSASRVCVAVQQCQTTITFMCGPEHFRSHTSAFA